MDLILLLSGNKDKIIEKHGLDPNNVEVVKIDEKELIQFSRLVKLIKNKKYRNIYFGVYDIKYLRFEYFINLILLFSNKKGAIVDQFGIKQTSKKLNLILIQTPLFILEAFLSLVVVIYFKTKLKLLNIE